MAGLAARVERCREVCLTLFPVYLANWAEISKARAWPPKLFCRSKHTNAHRSAHKIEKKRTGRKGKRDWWQKGGGGGRANGRLLLDHWDVGSCAGSFYRVFTSQGFLFGLFLFPFLWAGTDMRKMCATSVFRTEFWETHWAPKSCQLLRSRKEKHTPFALPKSLSAWVVLGDGFSFGDLQMNCLFFFFLVILFWLFLVWTFRGVRLRLLYGACDVRHQKTKTHADGNFGVFARERWVCFIFVNI